MGERFKYCVNCGEKNPINSKYCKRCGYQFNMEEFNRNSSDSSLKDNYSNQLFDKHFNKDYSDEVYPENTNEKHKKHLIAGLLVVLILIVSVTTVVVMAGSPEDVPYLFKADEIQVNSVTQTDYQSFVADTYTGSAKVYNVEFITKEDLADTTIEVYGYDSNNQLLDNVGNFFGTNESNVILSNDTPANTITNANVVFSKKGYDDFQLKYLKIFVYKNSNGNKELVDKFTYKVS